MEIRDRYGDERRTEIVEDDSDIAIEDLITEEDMAVTISHEGYGNGLLLPNIVFSIEEDAVFKEQPPKMVTLLNRCSSPPHTIICCSSPI